MSPITTVANPKRITAAKHFGQSQAAPAPVGVAKN
jgi:hypothetical protein